VITCGFNTRERKKQSTAPERAMARRSFAGIDTATHYNTLQRTATHCNTQQLSATLYTTLQHITTRCNTGSATLCNTLQETARDCNTLQHSATLCNTMQHSATLCNTLQHAQRVHYSCRALLKGHFPQKSRTISGSFAGRNLQLKAFYASSPPCITSPSLHDALEGTHT